MAQQQPQQAIHKFVLGNKELEGKTAEFQYDKGWYSITDIVGEERSVIYKSRNAQEAYMKWNVYIGRKKERPSSAKNSDADHGSRADGNRANDSREHRSRDFREKRDMTDRRGIMQEGNARMIEELTGIPVIAKVKDGDGELAIDIEKLKKIYN